MDRIKERYPVGTRIQLINMDDAQSIPGGTVGTVYYVDDIGQLHMKWDNGRSLALIPNVDQFVIVQEEIKSKINGQSIWKSLKQNKRCKSSTI